MDLAVLIPAPAIFFLIITLLNSWKTLAFYLYLLLCISLLTNYVVSQVKYLCNISFRSVKNNLNQQVKRVLKLQLSLFYKDCVKSLLIFFPVSLFFFLLSYTINKVKARKDKIFLQNLEQEVTVFDSVEYYLMT